MKRIILSLSCVATMATSFAQDCSKIFISEYVEGLGNNKAIEIYNPTSEAVNLGDYFLQRYNNGSTSASAQGTFQARTIQLPSVSLQPYDVFVIVLDRHAGNAASDDPAVWTELYSIADAHLCSSYDENNVMNFNGNDGLILAKGNATSPSLTQQTIYDVFGKIGEDPKNAAAGTNGWSSVAPFNMTSGNANDKVVTENHSMIRKSTVKVGATPWPYVFATFNPLLEWDSIPPSLPKIDPVTGAIIYQNDGVTPQWVGNWSSLGSHNCACAPLSVDAINLDAVKLFPNPSTGVITISGIENAVSVVVYNALGQVVEQIDNNTQATVSFDLTEKTGVYMVKLTDRNGRSATQKVIVK